MPTVQPRPRDPAVMNALEVADLREGRLDEVPFPRLLHALSQAQRTVVAELSHRAVVKKTRSPS